MILFHYTFGKVLPQITHFKKPYHLEIVFFCHFFFSELVILKRFLMLIVLKTHRKIGE